MTVLHLKSGMPAEACAKRDARVSGAIETTVKRMLKWGDAVIPNKEVELSAGRGHLASSDLKVVLQRAGLGSLGEILGFAEPCKGRVYRSGKHNAPDRAAVE